MSINKEILTYRCEQRRAHRSPSELTIWEQYIFCVDLHGSEIENLKHSNARKLVRIGLRKEIRTMNKLCFLIIQISKEVSPQSQSSRYT